MSSEDQKLLLPKLKKVCKDDLTFGLIYYAINIGFTIEKIETILKWENLSFESIINKKSNTYVNLANLVLELNLTGDDLEDIMDVNYVKAQISDVSPKAIKETARNARILDQIEKILKAEENIQGSDKYEGSSKIIDSIEMQLYTLACNGKKDLVFFLMPPKNDYFKNDFDKAYSKLKSLIFDYLDSIQVSYFTQGIRDWMEDTDALELDIDYSIPEDKELDELDVSVEDWENEPTYDEDDLLRVTRYSYDWLQIEFNLHDSDIEFILATKYEFRNSFCIFYINWYDPPQKSIISTSIKKLDCFQLNWLAKKDGQSFVKKIFKLIVEAQKNNLSLISIDIEKVGTKDSYNYFYKNLIIKFFTLDHLLVLFTKLGYKVELDDVSSNLYKLKISF